MNYEKVKEIATREIEITIKESLQEYEILSLVENYGDVLTEEELDAVLDIIHVAGTNTDFIIELN